ncbi:hypothetical protein GF325_13955 [Candidatus Bathyarchaeota archaeon]|nr:hypothetical protein [Candidatus Bathyarchaeota archaeon]
MPGFVHVVIALGLSLFLYIVTGKKFGVKHAIIFSVNSFVGPDIFGILDYRSKLYVFFHGYGWFLAAIPLALLWSVYTKYTLQWKPFEVGKRDPSKEHVITVPEVFCLVAAGGIFHQFMDLVGHPSYITYEGVANTPWGAVWFGGENWFSVEAIWGTGMFPCGNEFGFWENYVYLGACIGLALILIIFYMPKGDKSFIKDTLLIIGVASLPLIIFFFIPDYSNFDIMAEDATFFGNPADLRSVFRITGGEADLGVFVYYVLFMFVPLALLYLGYRGVPGVELGEYRQRKRELESKAKRDIEKEMEQFKMKRNA